MAETLFDELAEAIATNRAVVVAGAGVAIAATKNAKTASWIGLLRDGVDRVVGRGLAPTSKWAERQHEILSEAASGQGDLPDLLSVAEQVAKRLGWPDAGDWAAWLKSAVGELRVEDSSVIEAIAGLGVPIVTTNYDSLIEEVTRLEAVTWQEGSRVLDVLRRTDRGVLHWHGCYRQPASVILGIRDYQTLVGANLPQHLQKVAATISSLLFIGCGETLNDPNFAAFRTWLQQTMRTTEHLHFRLARDNEVEGLRKEHSQDERVAVIGAGETHQDLVPFQHRLRKATQILSREQGVAPALPRRGSGIDLELYAERARAKWETVDLTALAKPGSVDEDWRPKLREVFIPPNARRARPWVSLTKDYLRRQGVDEGTIERSEEEALKRWEEAERAPVLSFLTRGDVRHAVILGDPGAGKSCLARYILLRLLERLPESLLPDHVWRQALSGHTPFLIELRDFITERARNGTGLLTYLGESSEKLGFGFGAPQLEAQTIGSPTVLILDGLDEIFDVEMRRGVVEEIIGLKTQPKHSAMRLIVTSRIAGFNARPFEDAGFGILTLDDLTEGQVKTFAEGWYPLACVDQADAELCSTELRQSIQSRPQLQAIAGNPLILTIMAIIARHGH